MDKNVTLTLIFHYEITKAFSPSLAFFYFAFSGKIPLDIGSKLNVRRSEDIQDISRKPYVRSVGCKMQKHVQNLGPYQTSIMDLFLEKPLTLFPQKLYHGYLARSYTSF